MSSEQLQEIADRVVAQARTGEQVENAGIGNCVEAHERVEHRLPHPIEGGTRVLALWGNEITTSGFTGNDSHLGDRTLFLWTLNSA